MAHKFSLHFKHSWITRQGPKLITLGLGNRRRSVHPGTRKCYEYVIKNPEKSTTENVQLAPVRQSQISWLYGPATVLSTRSIVYPCIRGKCSCPCPCRICRKAHPRCREGQSCSCAECKLFYEDHTNFHGCFHYGCKSCFNILSVLPSFNFFFLDKSRKPQNLDVFIEGSRLEPTFELPRGTGMRSDMAGSHFLARQRWEEKLKNWNSGVQDNGIWCLCNTMFFSTDKLREHILSSHSVSKMFRHHFENDDTRTKLESKCDQCSRSFGTIGELTRHLQSVHHQERIECPDCSETFSRMDNFKLHKKNKHTVTHDVV